MSEVILRDGRPIRTEINQNGVAGNIEQTAQCRCGRLQQLILRSVDRAGIAGAADEDANEAMVLWCVVGEYAVGPQYAHERKIRFILGHEKAESIERVADVRSTKAQIKHNQRSALDGSGDVCNVRSEQSTGFGSGGGHD